MSTETSQKPSLSQSQLDFLAKFGSMPRLGSDSNVIPPTKAPNVRVQAQPIIDNKPSNDDAYFLAPPDPVGIEATKVITTLPPKNVQNTVPPKEVPLVNVEKSLDRKSDSPHREVTSRTFFPPSVTSLLKDYISSVKDNYDLYTDDQFVQFVEEAGGAKQFSLTEDIDCDVPEKYYKAFVMRVRDTIENYASARYHRIVSPKIKEAEKAAVEEQLVKTVVPSNPATIIQNISDEDLALDQLDRHCDIGMRKFEISMTGYPDDVARAIIFVLYVNPEDVPYGYSADDLTTVLKYNMIKDIKTGYYYTWDITTRIWKLFEQKTAGSHPKTRAFNEFIERYISFRTVLANAVHESNDEAFKANSSITIKKITTLIGKLKKPSYKDSVWKFVDESLSVDFYSFCNPISQELPLSDGKLYHIFTKESRLRTQTDYFTYCFNARCNEEITSIKPSDDILNSIDPEMKSNPHRLAWEFIHDLMSHDEEKTLFLIKRLGIFLSGNLFDQSYMIWVGDANNGKSVLLRYLSWILGECCGPAAPGVFLDTGSKEAANAHTAHLCALKGLRLAYLCETKPGGVISSANVKAITGGDDIKTREAYDKISKNFVALCHLILATQHLPIIDTNDQGMLKRTLVVPFRTFYQPPGSTYTNPNSILTIPEKKDYLDKVLKTPAVADAFLTMLMLSAHEYYSDNYTAFIPQQVKLSLTNYAEASFAYSDFISEVCVLGGPEVFINSARMYEYYSAYYNGKCDSSKVFVGRMTKRFNRQRKGTGGEFSYIGVDVDVKKLQDVIARRRTFHLTLNVITDAQKKETPNQHAQQLITPAVSEWINNTIAKQKQ